MTDSLSLVTAQISFLVGSFRPHVAYNQNITYFPFICDLLISWTRPRGFWNSGGHIELTIFCRTQEPQLSLIHIPIEVYTAFIQPIFQLLFGEDHDGDAAKIPWTNRHDFLNVTITPVECSVICEQRLAQVFFTPLLEQYKTAHGRFKSGSDGPEVGNEDYTVIQVDGQGLDAGQRVLELTSPLAMAGM